MKRISSHLTYSNVVSTLCLFILLGGGAYAAVKLPKNSVGTKQLKNNAVKGSKVANRTLTSADISGPVDNASNAAEADHAAKADQATNADHAATADQATNANQLGGAAASSFFPSSKVKRVDLEVHQATPGSRTDPLLTMGPLTLTMTCSNSASQSIGINAASSASSAKFGWGFTSSDEDAQAESTFLTSTPKGTFSATDIGLTEAGAGELVYRDSGTTIAITFNYVVSNLFDDCSIYGVAVQT